VRAIGCLSWFPKRAYVHHRARRNTAQGQAGTGQLEFYAGGSPTVAETGTVFGLKVALVNELLDRNRGRDRS